MEVTQITAVIGAAASLLCTLVVGALTFFIKKTLTSLESADKKNGERIDKVEASISDLKADLPLIYVLREDFFRSMNSVDENFKDLNKKMDRMINLITSGKE